MKGPRAISPYSVLISTLGAALGSDQGGASNSQGLNPLHYLLCHGGASAFIMNDPIPVLNPAEFGSYENYLAARVDGIRATRGMSRAEAIGQFANTGVLARGAWAPSGSRKPNRSITSAIEGQRLMAGGEFDPSAAVRKIDMALQTAKRSRPTLNWDEISREICGLYTTLPVNSAFIDRELDLAKAIAVLQELSGFGTSTDLRNT